jgi:hypothetical protein
MEWEEKGKVGRLWGWGRGIGRGKRREREWDREVKKTYNIFTAFTSMSKCYHYPVSGTSAYSISHCVNLTITIWKHWFTNNFRIISLHWRNLADFCLRFVDVPLGALKYKQISTYWLTRKFCELNPNPDGWRYIFLLKLWRDTVQLKMACSKNIFLS